MPSDEPTDFTKLKGYRELELKDGKNKGEIFKGQGDEFKDGKLVGKSLYFKENFIHDKEIRF